MWEEVRNAYRILVGKPEGKRPRGRHWLRWWDIKMKLKKIGCEVVHWIYLVQERVQWQAVINTVMNI
jgi:hypothetical protein